MTNTPDEIRANIEATRSDLGSDVDALADKVTPSKIAHRQASKVKNAFADARERVMGSASDLADHGSSASDAATDAAHAVKAKAEGNPLAVGLIAFGIGWLAASLLPASEKEKQVASSVKDAAQPLVDDLKETAKDVAGNLREPAQDAANAVKDTAMDAADDVKSEASSAVDDVKGQASDARDEIQSQ
jgi:gas vesicle protein